MAPTVKKALAAALSVILGAGFVLLCPDIGLGEQGMRCLGILLGAVVWWVAGVLPEYTTGLLMVALFAVLANVPVDVSFSAFASETWWLLVGAFAIGAGMKRCGLMKRMALAVVRHFPNSFAAQSAGLMAAGTIIGPLIPSLAAKASILEPIAFSIGESLGYQPGNKQMRGLFMATLAGVRTIGPAAVTASVCGYALLAMLPATSQEHFNMFSWFIAALPWFLTTALLTYICIQLMYRPHKVSQTASKSTQGCCAQSIAPPSDLSELPKPQPMSRQERCMLVIVLLAIALWITEPLHHIASHVVALGAFVCMIACNVLNTQSVRSDINWTSLIFIGIAIGLAKVFSVTGIEEWIVSIAQPVFTSLTSNSYLFVLGIGVMTIALRFLIVSELAYINIMMAFLVPLAMGAGVEPWVVGLAIYATVNPWFVPYQNPVYLAAYYSVDGKMATHAQAAGFCAVYLACCFVGLAVSVPCWQWMGLL